MDIDREHPEEKRGPAEWFTGVVWMQKLAGAQLPSRTEVLAVSFAPGARTAWHSHPYGQVLHITEGDALVQSRGGPVQVVRHTQTVRFAPGEEHWHGATADAPMGHLAVHEVDESGTATTWGTHVTDAEYASYVE